MHRWVALVRRAGGEAVPVVRHYRGLPQEFSTFDEPPQLLPRPELLILEETPDGWYLYRYTASGEFSGDTWHSSLEEAREQAGYEFGESMSAWQLIPEEIEDALSYALRLLGAAPQS
jgi:hypothetical protein